MVLEVTAKAKDGKEVFRQERHYHPQATNCRNNKMLYGAQWKTSYIRDTSLQPYQAKAETFEIALPEGVRAVEVTVELNYEINTPDNKAPIHKVTRQVSLDR
ncbi:MAG: hypothetical protein Kow0025_19300 [Thermodesulfovibrionales bacterium]